MSCPHVSWSQGPDRIFTGCVAPHHCNPVAHGWASYVRVCFRCHCVQRTNHNGSALERSSWELPAPIAYARALPRPIAIAPDTFVELGEISRERGLRRTDNVWLRGELVRSGAYQAAELLRAAEHWALAPEREPDGSVAAARDVYLTLGAVLRPALWDAAVQL